MVETVCSSGSARAANAVDPHGENPDAVVMDLSEQAGAVGETSSREDAETGRQSGATQGGGDGGYEAMADGSDDAAGGKQNEEFHYDDAEIQRDAANDRVALLVHIFLALFAFAFMCAVVGSAVLVSQYGFLAFLINVTLVTLVAGSGYFISKALVSDKQLRPIRKKVKRWRAVAEAVVVNELRNFKLDMHEHMLLTTGDGEDYEDEEEEDGGDEGKQRGETTVREGSNTNTAQTSADAEVATNPKKKKSKSAKKKKKGNDGKPRSVLFGLVKPFMKPKGSRKKKGIFGRKKKGKGTGDSTMPIDGYVPPAADVALS